MTKRCYKCGHTKLIEDFPRNRSKKDGRSYLCSACNKIVVAEHYQKNRQRYIEKAAIRDQRVLDISRRIKSQSSCVDCGVSYPDEPWLMDFDHTENDKHDNVATLAQKGNISKMMAEIEKCEIVCLICHRRRTAKRACWNFKRSDTSNT